MGGTFDECVSIEEVLNKLVRVTIGTPHEEWVVDRIQEANERIKQILLQDREREFSGNPAGEYYNENTLDKVYNALGELNLEKDAARDIVFGLQNHGILFRERR